MNQIPEKLINFKVYEGGSDLLGIADVELPSIEAMTETVKGAGIAGEIDSPVLGHFGSMSLKINWRTVVKSTVHLAQQKAHSLDLRGAIQTYNSGAGTYRAVPLKVVVKCIPKKTELGKLDVGVKGDASSEFEVVYLKLTLDGKEYIEIDKFNYIAKIGGVDALKDVRSALGL